MKTVAINSSQAPSPDGGYSQAMLIEGVSKILFISGQIPETVNGETPDDFESQCRLVWSNIKAQLKATEMDISNLMKITIFLSSREHADTNSIIRQEILGGHRPALTVIITGIYDDKWLIEIEAIAAS